jgi:hypothetical protein
LTGLWRNPLSDSAAPMTTSKSFARFCLLAVVCAIGTHCKAQAPGKPLGRVFTAESEERYEVSVSMKAQTQSVSTETVASTTYVMPVVHSAQVQVTWNARRRILSTAPDGAAEIEETSTPTHRCEQVAQPRETADTRLLESLSSLCAALAAPVSIRYTEDAKGAQRESGVSKLPLDFGEGQPPLLALWLRRAVRPSVVFPSLAFAVGASATQELRPSGELWNNARGSESTDWLEADSATPAASLHVVQQLAWDPTTQTKSAMSVAKGTVPKHEDFFADSITALSLLDGSVVRANRSASRTTSHKIDPVAGLPEAPDFSSRLTISVLIERLP